MDRYRVGVYDCCGEFGWEDVIGFADVPTTAARLRAKYPGKVIDVTNLDRNDYDTNGLTEDEREAL